MAPIELLTPPATPNPTPPNANIYAKARSAIRQCSVLTGRASERQSMLDFLDLNKAGGSLYVSGPPGAGKTACIRNIIASRTKSESSKGISCVYVNCMSLNSPAAIWTAILSGCGQPDGPVTDSKERLERYLSCPKQGNMTLILDEIDHLSSSGLSGVLSLPKTIKHHSVHSIIHVIGIANTMSLTQSLSASITKSVQLLHFPAYTDSQLNDILQAQLGPEFSPLVDKMALSLAGKKVAASSGDLRRAMDVTCNALDLVEKERRRAFEFEAADEMIKNPSSDASSTLPLTLANTKMAALTCLTASKVTPSHVIKAFNALVKSKVATKTTGLAGLVKGLPLHARLALACFVLALRRNPTTRFITTADLFSNYLETLQRSNSSIKPLQRSEFSGPVTMLVDNGILISGALTPSKRKSSSRGGGKSGSEPHLSLGGVESEIMRGLTEGVGTAENHLIELIHQEERHIQKATEAKIRGESQATRIPLDVLR